MSIEDFAAQFVRSAQVSVDAAYDVLSDRLAAEVQVLHRPSAPDLDGWRTRRDMEAYLYLEALAIPRAFAADLRLVVATKVTEGRVVVDPWTWSGTLRGQDPRLVSIRFVVDLQFKNQMIERIEGRPHPDTDKGDIRAWLRAIDACGRFAPGPGLYARPH